MGRGRIVDTYEMREFLNSRLKKKVEEEREKRNPEAKETDEQKVEKICNSILTSKSVPSYAKAGFRDRESGVKFARFVLKNIKDKELVFRFINNIAAIEGFVEDLNSANWNRGHFPIVCYPANVVAEIMGEEYEAPEEKEHWPDLGYADQPIGWDR